MRVPCAFLACLAGWVGCSGDGASGLDRLARGRTEEPASPVLDGGAASSLPPRQAALDAAGVAALGDAGLDCGRETYRTRPVVPDVLILLDRSGSMRGARPDLRCDDLSPFDEDTQEECLAAGIDCTRSEDRLTRYCGGTRQGGPVDRWAPSVAAVKALTMRFDREIRFGLLTFPASHNECGPGDFKVALGTGRAAEIAVVLDTIDPGGGTPTAESLQAARSAFRMADGPLPNGQKHYVLLVTDGQPTCPNGNGSVSRADRLQADKDLTLGVLDLLRKDSIETFVVGYDAALDPALASALTEFAEHGGTQRYYPVQDESTLRAALERISTSVLSCNLEFTRPVGDRKLLHVTLDGETLRPDAPDGWTLEGTVITVLGAACEKLQTGRGHAIEIVLECEPVTYL